MAVIKSFLVLVAVGTITSAFKTFGTVNVAGKFNRNFDTRGSGTVDTKVVMEEKFKKVEAKPIEEETKSTPEENTEDDVQSMQEELNDSLLLQEQIIGFEGTPKNEDKETKKRMKKTEAKLALLEKSLPQMKEVQSTMKEVQSTMKDLKAEVDTEIKTVKETVKDTVESLKKEIKESVDKTVQEIEKENKEEMAKVVTKVSKVQDKITTLVERNDLLSTDVVKCKEGYQGFAKSCYLFSTDFLSWGDAKTKCEQLGAQLVIINNDKEDRFLKKMAWTRNSVSYYVGASDIDSEGNWQWVDGKENPYTNWYPNQPNGERDQNCLNLWGDFRFGWDDERCAVRHNYICEYML